MEILNQHFSQISEACSTNQVKKLFAFGSVTRNELNDQSDIDLVVDLEDQDPLRYADCYFNLKETLEHVLKRHVDLLEYKAIRNPVLRQEIDRTKVLIYGS